MVSSARCLRYLRGRSDFLAGFLHGGFEACASLCPRLVRKRYRAGALLLAAIFARPFTAAALAFARVEARAIVFLCGGTSALTGASERHPVAIPSVAPIGTGKNYEEDVRRAGSFQFMVTEGVVESLVEAALRFALSEEGVSPALG